MGSMTTVSQDVDDVLELMRARGFKMTPQRRAIVSEVLGTDGHIAPAALADRVKHRIPGVNTATVYRTLLLLDQLGVLAHAHLEGGVEYHLARHSDHVHLICSSCGARRSLPAAEIASLTRSLRTRHDFDPDLTHFAVAGLCGRCRRRTTGVLYEGSEAAADTSEG
jgi:Fur family transcriptional regulator, ferric uptake regulator